MRTQRTNKEVKVQSKFQEYEPISGQYIQTTNTLLLLNLKLT